MAKFEPLLPDEVELWRSNLERVVQPEAHLLRFIATVDMLAAALRAADRALVLTRTVDNAGAQARGQYRAAVEPARLWLEVKE